MHIYTHLLSYTYMYTYTYAYTYVYTYTYLSWTLRSAATDGCAQVAGGWQREDIKYGYRYDRILLLACVLL